VFELFTAQARQVILVSQDEAISLGHDFIGTEHLLLGLVTVTDGLAGQVLATHGVTVERTRSEAVRLLAAAGVTGTGGRDAVEALATIGIDVAEIRRRADDTFGPGRFTFPRPAYTDLAKKALELSVGEAQMLGADYIGTEHLLLGLLAGNEGLALTALSSAGIDPAGLRQAVLNRLAPDAP
jgi:ATP-dependent Clp protease ATP-binding subunit ClpA